MQVPKTAAGTHLPAGKKHVPEAPRRAAEEAPQSEASGSGSKAGPSSTALDPLPGEARGKQVGQGLNRIFPP